MRKFIILLGACLLICFIADAQVNARMFRFPDVSQNQICFVYAGDIWVVSKSGGLAQKLSSPKGEEMFPRFSPDGQTIAFTGNYDGNQDVYTLPVKGGIPKRLTFHGFSDQVRDWHPSGDKILFRSTRKSGRQRYGQFYLVSKEGGMAEQLPLVQAEFGSFSPDGKKMAFTDRSRVFRTWKRYRGGTAPDVYVYDLDQNTSVNITNNAANDELPMWNGNKIYYLSDQGPAKRYNIWVYDQGTKQSKQLTKFTEFDAHFPGMGPQELVFEAGGKLYLLNLASEEYKEVNIQVNTDFISLAPRAEKVANLMSHMNISPDGKRVLIEARGDIFSVPAENGYVKNLTASSGVADRYPAWSPDGKTIAYSSDRNGEYQLTLYDLATNTEKTLTSYTSGYRYHLFWSPNSKKLAFIDQAMKIHVYDLNTQKTTQVDQALFKYHGALEGFRADWSSDSRWLAYAREQDNGNHAIYLYNTDTQAKHQITSEFYNNNQPTFDPDGKYLYVSTNRNFSPVYSDYEGTFVYPNATHLAAICLRKDVKSPLAPKNDEVAIQEDKKEDGGEDKGKGNKSKDKAGEGSKNLVIDLDGIEERLVILPMKPGNYGALAAVKGKLIYQKWPNSGSGDNQSPLMYFDLKERESKTIVGNASQYAVSADGKKILVRHRRNIAVVSIAPKQKMDKPISLGEMAAMVDPKAEWQQILDDVWRFQRDMFYDEKMHGLDWNAIRSQYNTLLKDAVTRSDVNFVIGEVIGELNASHTYRGGGDMEYPDYRNVGYLGLDWQVSQGKYQIKKIIKGAPWDAKVRSPLAQPGVDVKEGEYILAVNGVDLDVNKEPYAAFQGLGRKTVELLVNSSPSKEGARSVIVKALSSESRLRHLAWIESNRKRVEEATNGEVGYVYVRSTGIDGQNELVRQFYGQFHKKGVIIDERFNSGGQIPDRFIELLNRKPLAYWAVRDGKDWQWPQMGNFGVKAMLINGWSGSGGDAFPDYFKKAGLGPLIGGRTWGGLIGITGAPGLVDGGFVTVPTFRMYNPDGTWFKEGYGVDPDIEVPENPGELAQGTDGQLERAIQYVKSKLGSQAAQPAHAGYEKR